MPTARIQNRMRRSHLVLFMVSLAGLSWWAMMAVHELGHVVGAVTTGGRVQRVVLHPLAISRTDVSPNPHPALVVWLGPIVGCLLPLALFVSVPRQHRLARNLAQFFAGFCLVANGAYISVGSFEGVGDCGEMLRTGTPQWVMLAFGAATIPLGLWLWHRLGSIVRFIRDPADVEPRLTYAVAVVWLTVLLVAFVLSSR
jgi:hypothetical protein